MAELSLDTSLPLNEVVDMIFYDITKNNPRVKGKSPAVPFMRAKPGGGKTESFMTNAAKIDFGVLTTHLSTMTLEELTGLPNFTSIEVDGKKEEGTSWSYPDLISKLHVLAKTHKGVVWLMDDYHLASPEMQKFCFQLFTEYKMKGYSVPDNCHIVCIGNPSAKAGAKAALSAISNRMAFYDTYTDVDNWVSWANSNGVDGTITTFLKKSNNRKHFHGTESTLPWPSPRSWTNFSVALKNDKERFNGKVPLNQLMFRAMAHVGTEAAKDYSVWFNLFAEINAGKTFDTRKITLKKGSNTNLYIYAMAMCYEYIDRVMKSIDKKDKKGTESLTSFFVELVKEVSKHSRDQSIVMFKEISEPFKNNENREYMELLFTPFAQIAKDDKDLHKEIADSIKLFKSLKKK